MNLKTIAKMSGVSTATVSNVINGNYQKVSQETRERVEKIIRENDYQPNAMARSLAKKESRLIGLVVPYVGSGESFLVNPYYATMIAELERYVRNHDYYLILRCVSDCRSMIPQFSSWKVDGAFFLGVMEDEIEDIKKGLDAPMVFIDTYTKKKDIVTVGIDDYRGGYLSARYLIGKGHDKLALAIPDHHIPGVIQERYKGFVDACREISLDFCEEDVYYTECSFDYAVGVGQSIVFSNRSYTAIATMSDIAAMGISEGLRQCGLRLPEEMSVIGFDNLEQGAYASVKLTTIAQDFRRKAELAGERLIRMIDGEKDLAEEVRLPIRVVERQSVVEYIERWRNVKSLT